MRNQSITSARGSVLLVAMIFATLLALGLGSYLAMATGALKISRRSFTANEAMNVTEAGLEQALWTFNLANDQDVAGETVTAWDSWIIDGDSARKIFTDFSLSNGCSATVQVVVGNYNSPGLPQPTVICKATVTPSEGPVIVKMVQVRLSRRSPFEIGLVGRNGVSFNGNNAYVDSWNSNPFGVTPSPNYPYNSVNAPRRANGSVSTGSLNSAVSVMNADIFGYVSVAAPTNANIRLGPNGKIGGFSQPSGTKDDSHIAADFVEDLPPARSPTAVWVPYMEGGSNRITGSANLPTEADIAAHRGVSKFGVTTYYYTVQDISTNGTLAVKPGYNVALRATSSGTSVSTSGDISIGAGGKLSIYTDGNVTIGGGGIANASGSTAGFELWSTATTVGQVISIKGQGSLTGLIYAPNANVTIAGNGYMAGSVVANSITMSGNGEFHYDEALVNYGLAGSLTPFRASQWNELRSAEDRAVNAETFNF